MKLTGLQHLQVLRDITVDYVLLVALLGTELGCQEQEVVLSQAVAQAGVEKERWYRMPSLTSLKHLDDH